MFSVIIPLFNKEQSIKSTLNSVVLQKFSDFEVIVINDGSTDESEKKVREIKDSRIRLINQVNGGVSKARNRGIKEAENEWIVFLDADDLWRNDHLDSLKTNILKYPEYKAFCNSYTRSDFKTEERIEEKDKDKIVDDYFIEGLKSFFFWTGVVCIHKDVFEEVGIFDERLSRGEDLDVWNRVGRNYSIIWSKKVTAIYKQDTENKLTRSKVLLEKCFENYLDFNDKSLTEKAYLKMLARAKIISLLKQFIFIDALKLILKYNLKIL
ncbi:Beta-1,3-glucosyltransferase [Tenacibaculum sp. 190524A02b]|uniref:glycosyltransferase family 2 protein n=1 Tax=Tenacibaculum vairaonense TaxID=3137860 RepID=UPI0032B2D7B4